MSDKNPLSPSLAFQLCNRLIGFRRRQTVNVELYAEKMIQYCIGGHRNGRYWPPAEQAEWMINQILDHWVVLGPPAAMRELIAHNFTIDPPFTLGTKPLVDCSKCNDYGFDTATNDRCSCLAGQQLHPNVLSIFRKSVSPITSKVRVDSGASTIEKLAGYGFKRKPKPKPMTKANTERVNSLLQAMRKSKG